jgi:hypothetical protein
MDLLSFALALVAVFGVVSLAVWWFRRKKLADDELPWELSKRRAPTRDEPTQSPPAEEAIPAELQPAVRKLRSDMPMVVAATAQELGRSNHPAAVGLLIPVLENNQRSVQFAVFEALLALRAHSVLPLRAASATTTDAGRRSLIALILDQIARVERGEAPVPTEEILSMSDAQVRQLTSDLRRN